MRAARTLAAVYDVEPQVVADWRISSGLPSDLSMGLARARLRSETRGARDWRVGQYDWVMGGFIRWQTLRTSILAVGRKLAGFL